ncbi:TPA: ABC-2 transporter permease [Clostridioides difficile]|jgi:ABC-2 type transport system permease protein
MFNLVKKDFILSRKINIFAAIYALFIAAMGRSVPNHPISSILYMLGMIMLIFISVIYTNGYDDKYKTEIVLNSFPIDKRDIVRGKYLTLIIYIIIGCGAVLIFTNIFMVSDIGVNSKGASIWNAIFAANVSLIFYSIYYPFYFKIGEGIRSFNTILWIIMTVSPAIISKSMKSLEKIWQLEKILSIDINKINIYLLIFSLLIFYISMQVSKSIYLHKEF